MPATLYSASLEAEDSYGPEVSMRKGGSAAVSISGDATVTLQRRLDGENWRDVAQFEGSYEATYHADCDALVRLGVKTGDYGEAATTVTLAV